MKKMSEIAQRETNGGVKYQCTICKRKYSTKLVALGHVRGPKQYGGHNKWFPWPYVRTVAY